MFNFHVAGTCYPESSLDFLEFWINMEFKNEQFSSLGSRSGFLSASLVHWFQERRWGSLVVWMLCWSCKKMDGLERVLAVFLSCHKICQKFGNWHFWHKTTIVWIIDIVKIFTYCWNCLLLYHFLNRIFTFYFMAPFFSCWLDCQNKKKYSSYLRQE